MRKEQKSSMKKNLFLLIGIVIVFATFMVGCSVSEGRNEKIKDLDFTVMGVDDIPEEFKTYIENEKMGVFKRTFTDNEYLYIGVGYGEQSTGGYSITVNELYVTANAIYIDTNLIGPSIEDQKREVVSYPYVVVKLEYLDKTVVFD